jgi:hypothetical protein
MADIAPQIDYVRRPVPRGEPGKRSQLAPAATSAPPAGAKMVKRPDPAKLAALLRMFAKGGTSAFLNKNSRIGSNNP